MQENIIIQKYFQTKSIKLTAEQLKLARHVVRKEVYKIGLKRAKKGKVSIFNKQEIIELLKTNKLKQVSKILEVKYNSLYRFCKKNNINN
jgi:hypothetical protein